MATGTQVTVTVFADKVKFEGSGTQINLERSRITDANIKTEKEIQTHVVSSAGGAVAGGALLGALGAAIGGRAKTKKTIEISYFLIFTYIKDDSVDYIAFDVTTRSWWNDIYYSSVWNYPREFQNLEKNKLVCNQKISLNIVSEIFAPPLRAAFYCIFIMKN